MGAPHLRAAADWLARRDAGFSARDAVDYAAWLDADPAHRAAADRLASTWTKLDGPLSTGTADAVLGELARRARRRRQKRSLAFSAAALAVLLAGGFGWHSMRPANVTRSPAVGSAAVLLPVLQSLPDGSVAELRDGAEIAIEFSDRERRIALKGGEAFFKVAKNPARPFVVVAGAVEVRAIGTAFSVDRGRSAVDVVVTEGRVAVAVAAAESSPGRTTPAEPLLVGAGQGATVATAARRVEAEVRAVAEPDLEARLAWRSPRLEFSGTPLLEAVTLLNRHNRVQFTVEDPELARMRVSGILGATNTDAFVRLLTASFNVECQRRGDDEIVLRRRPPAGKAP